MINRVEKFLDFHPSLRDAFIGTSSPSGAATTGFFATHPFQRLLEELLGGPLVLYKEKINFKLPGGDGFKPHQDAQAGWDQYGHTVHFNLLVAIDEATVDNGCLELVRGAHQSGLLGPMWAELPDEVVSSLTWEAIPLQPGDIIVFDSYAPHQSAPNLTTQPRRALYVTYNLAAEGDYREQYFADKRAAFPPDIERVTNREYRYRI
jgi:ectoine hydroxylase-related dioxygenase (phytanoyl-CoA dioxygenase family)